MKICLLPDNSKGNMGLSSHNLAYFAFLRAFARGLLEKSIFEFYLAKRAKNRKARKGNIGLSSHNLAYFAYLRSFARGLLEKLIFEFYLAKRAKNRKARI